MCISYVMTKHLQRLKIVEELSRITIVNEENHELIGIRGYSLVNSLVQKYNSEKEMQIFTIIKSTFSCVILF